MYWANLLHIYQPPGQKKYIIDKVVDESYDKILSVLEERPKVKISLNICASLTEQLIEHGRQDIIERIRKLAERGQIELVGSAKYHAILPFLPKSEVIRQIKLNENLNQKYFGKIWRPRPKGFFLPELAYNKKTARIIQSLGYEWIVLDEISYNGKFGQVLFNQGYEIKDLFPGQKKKGLKLIFRNRVLSLLFFGKWLDSVDKFFSAVKKDKRSHQFLVTAFDGENLGHHHQHLIDVWAQILDQEQVKTITCSDYLTHLRVRPLSGVNPLDSSWSTEVEDLKQGIPYPLWNHPENKIHKLQRRLANVLIKTIKTCQDDSNYKKARKLLDQALASDQYWWASGSPWWSSGMIKRFVKYFQEIVQLLQNSMPAQDQKNIKELAEMIVKQVEKRNQS